MEELTFQTDALIEASMYFDVVQTLLKSNELELLEFATQQAYSLLGKHILAFSDGFCAIKTEDALYALISALNPRNLQSIKLLRLLRRIQPSVSLGLLPYAFLPQFPLPLPTPLTEYGRTHEFTPRPAVYVGYQKRFKGVAHPLAKLISHAKLWLLAGFLAPEDAVKCHFLDDFHIVSELKQQFRMHTQVNEKIRTLRELVQQYQEQRSRGVKFASIQQLNPSLVGVLNDLYKSDELKLFDSFSGYVYGAAFPDQRSTAFQTLGSGALSNICISDCVVEADLAQGVVLDIMRRLNTNSSLPALITKRLCFEYALGQLFCSKLDPKAFPELMTSFKIEEYSGQQTTHLVLALARQMPGHYASLARRLQIFPNAADIEIECLQLNARFERAAEQIVRLCDGLRCNLEALRRDVYAESGCCDDKREKVEYVIREMVRRVV